MSSNYKNVDTNQLDSNVKVDFEATLRAALAGAATDMRALADTLNALQDAREDEEEDEESCNSENENENENANVFVPRANALDLIAGNSGKINCSPSF